MVLMEAMLRFMGHKVKKICFHSCDIIRKNLERQETNKNGRTEQHLPKKDESVVRPKVERR